MRGARPGVPLHISTSTMEDKLVTLEDFISIRKRLHGEGKVVVFTNGCFDLIHCGHINYLASAKELGDVLVVAINSDNSMRQIKGPKRPIIPQEDRAKIVSALECVNYVIIFDEPTPKKLIKTILPDILVKGADWEPDEIVGADIVEKVVRIPLTEDQSTSAIIEKIVERYGDK